MNEWKSIPGCNKMYEANTAGEIKSVARLIVRKNGTPMVVKERKLKPYLSKVGYLVVPLSIDGKTKPYFVHRLVWSAFNGKIPEGMQVNHINEIKTDNRLDNLNLMTPKENSNWGTGHQRQTDACTNGKLSKPVLQYTLDGELVAEYPSARETGRNGFQTSSVIRCCNGILKQTGGFTWKYKYNKLIED